MCSYKGHVCCVGKIQFISRYHNENDYCVDGRRVTVFDNGSIRAWAAKSDFSRILCFELDRYAEYLKFRTTWYGNRPEYPKQPVQTFNFPTKPKFL